MLTEVPEKSTHLVVGNVQIFKMSCVVLDITKSEQF